MTSDIVFALTSPQIEQENAIIESVGVSTRDSSVIGEFDNRNDQAQKISKLSKKIKKEEINYKDLKDIIIHSSAAKNVTWTQSEDSLLLELVGLYGPDWSIIASNIKGKSRKQVSDRYLNTLKPNINHGEWTREEEILLVYLQKQFKDQWCKIAACLPSRTENQVREKLTGGKEDSHTLVKSQNSSELNQSLFVKQHQKPQGKALYNENGYRSQQVAYNVIPDRVKPNTFEQRADRFLQYTEQPTLKNFDAIFKDNFRDLDWSMI